MQCPRCHAETRDSLRFCEDCGARLGLTCSQCGADITSGKRFCGSCGAPVVGQTLDRFAAPEAYTLKHLAEKILTSRSALEGERKQVTVLFADLKGSMELLAGRDPEEARKILDPVVERMVEAVHWYEGTVNHVMGDGIMALFGAPIGHEDHAIRALYWRASRLFHELALARAAGTYPRLLARLARVDVLVLDDWGLAPVDDQQRQDLLEIFEDRYGLRSTVITSQLSPTRWHDYLAHPTLADAICDLILRHAHRIELKGESMRKVRGKPAEGG